VTLHELAAVAGMSAYHLSRLFRLETGLPPHEYQTQLRVLRAKTLLLRGESASEAAYSAGFASQSHLIRHFRRLVGTTPGRLVGPRKIVVSRAVRGC
jgi:AraC-like DNA-binding protein